MSYSSLKLHEVEKAKEEIDDLIRLLQQNEKIKKQKQKEKKVNKPLKKSLIEPMDIIEPLIETEEKNDISDFFEKIENIKEKLKKGKQDISQIKDMTEKFTEVFLKDDEPLFPKQQKKKLNIKKRSSYEIKLREHLHMLPLNAIRSIARASNLHTKIKIGSPKNKLVDAIAKLYDWENGIYKSKEFSLENLP
jgi:hypothetical protein